MSSFSEQKSIDPDNPELDYAPLRPSERAAKLGPLVAQGAQSQPISSLPVLRPALLMPKATYEPPSHTRDKDRRTALLSVAAAAAGVVVVAATLFVTMKPASRQSVGNPTLSETTGSIPQSNGGDVEWKTAPAELKAQVTSPPGETTNEQPQQLLQGFLKWREKANAEASHP
jgi:hypothetical protein